MVVKKEKCIVESFLIEFKINLKLFIFGFQIGVFCHRWWSSEVVEASIHGGEATVEGGEKRGGKGKTVPRKEFRFRLKTTKIEVNPLI